MIIIIVIIRIVITITQNDNNNNLNNNNYNDKYSNYNNTNIILFAFKLANNFANSFVHKVKYFEHHRRFRLYTGWHK